MSSLLAIVSDLHSGSKLALCPPVITLDEGGTRRAPVHQIWLWQRWLSFWDKVEALRGRGKARKELYIVINGEIRDGIKHSSQSITTNEADIFKICRSVLEPVISLKPDYSFIYRGTEAHSGRAGWFDELMADGLKEELNVQKNPNTKQLSSWSLNIWIEQVLLDIEHHGKTGNLPWTAAGAVERYAVELSYYYLSRKEKLPQIAIRGHKHTMLDSGDNAPIRVLTLPGWKFPDSYLHRAMPGKLPEMGGYILEIDGAEIKEPITKVREEAPRGKAWRKK